MAYEVGADARTVMQVHRHSIPGLTSGSSAAAFAAPDLNSAAIFCLAAGLPLTFHERFVMGRGAGINVVGARVEASVTHAGL